MKAIIILVVFIIFNNYCTARVTDLDGEVDVDTFDSIPNEQNEDIIDTKSDFANSEIENDANTGYDNNIDEQDTKMEYGNEEEAMNNDNLIQDQDINNVETESSCACASRVQGALITALEGCINVLKSMESCASRRKRDTADIAAVLMSSCSCSQQVNGALVNSLKSCTEAIDDAATCGSRARYPSCAALKQEHPRVQTGYYNLLVNGKPLRVYCNMDTLCRTGGGWTRLAHFDMTNSSTSCPKVAGLSQYTPNKVRMCGRSASGAGGCASIIIPSGNIKYSQVCGRVRGYQRYSTDAFHGRADINHLYVDGVSITRGSPRKHIWSLGSGFLENKLFYECPCMKGSQRKVPSFVGNDYYCETGAASTLRNKFYTSDPLWDGKLCRSLEAPCCPSGSLRPWFKKNIGSITTDYIELRVCANEGTGNENLGIDQYEIYVK